MKWVYLDTVQTFHCQKNCYVQCCANIHKRSYIIVNGTLSGQLVPYMVSLVYEFERVVYTRWSISDFPPSKLSIHQRRMRFGWNFNMGRKKLKMLTFKFSSRSTVRTDTTWENIKHSKFPKLVKISSLIDVQHRSNLININAKFKLTYKLTF